MSITPRLSICVPSRNRQIYFQETIRDMLCSLRVDVEFVLADNSDDPAVMNEFMTAYEGDPRVVYLPSTDRVLPMLENWERTIRAATGDYVVFIGDDDYADPDMIDVINGIEAKIPELDAVSWPALIYSWPSPERTPASVFVTLDNFFARIDQARAIKLMFGWEQATATPRSGFSIYHSAISRRLLDRILKLYPGDYFQHPTLDYEMAMKVILAGKNLVYTPRSLSVMGVCPLSNSSAVGNMALYRERLDTMKKELGRGFTEDVNDDSFPFPTEIGLTACVAQAQLWFKRTHGYEYSNWEENFVKACANHTEYYAAEDFEMVREAYASAIARWKGGKYLPSYQPKSIVEKPHLLATGFTKEGVYIDQDIAGVTTPYQLYRLTSGMMRPIPALVAGMGPIKTVDEIAAERKKKAA